MENQEKNNRDKEANQGKGYTPGKNNDEGGREEKSDSPQNLKWDQAQRRQQAGPRSYNESVESQNLSNQNTEADNEQVADDNRVNPNDPKKIGDQISERQQTIDEKDRPGEQK